MKHSIRKLLVLCLALMGAALLASAARADRGPVNTYYYKVGVIDRSADGAYDSCYNGGGWLVMPVRNQDGSVDTFISDGEELSENHFVANVRFADWDCQGREVYYKQWYWDWNNNESDPRNYRFYDGNGIKFPTQGFPTELICCSTPSGTKRYGFIKNNNKTYTSKLQFVVYVSTDLTNWTLIGSWTETTMAGGSWSDDKYVDPSMYPKVWRADEIEGPDEIEIPRSGEAANTYPFSTILADQYGAEWYQRNVSVTYSLSGAPAGVSIDQTGKVTVSPSVLDQAGTPGDFQFQVRAKGPNGATVTKTVTARWPKCTVTYKNSDGTQLEQTSDVPVGTVWSHTIDDPVKSPDANGHYAFAGWISGTGSMTISQDTIFTASYSAQAHRWSYNSAFTQRTCRDCGYAESGTYAGHAVEVGADTTAWEAGDTYHVSGNVTIADRVTVNGSVTLQLDAGATLTCLKGVSVFQGNSLTIQGSGTLIADASGYAQAAGIGGSASDGGRASGVIVINGGTVTATGGQYGAGIGGGMYGYCESVTINGGIVTATGGTRGAGIGGGGNYYWAGNYGNMGTITINGGTVTASGGGTGAGIGSGGGETSSSTTVKGGSVQAIVIRGGQVTASSPSGAAIGPGLYGSAQSITLKWTQVSDYISAGSIAADTIILEEAFHYKADGTDYGPVTAENLPGKDASCAVTPWLFNFEGYGTVNVPYLITSAEDWDRLSMIIAAGGLGYDHNSFRLTADISVTTMLGTDEYPFRGVFDGQGHRLNVNFNEPALSKCAPFRRFAGGTIKNLIVTGTIVGGTHSAGLVGCTESGWNQIRNCIVATNITVSGSNGYRHMGGIVGHGASATLTMEGCVFSGSMSTTKDYAGGLLGWSDGSTLNITNCLFAGSYSGGASFHPIAIRAKNRTMSGTVQNAYYSAEPTLTNGQFIAAAGAKAHAVTADSGVNILFLGASTTYNVSGITAYPTGLSVVGVFYAGEGEEVTLWLSDQAPEGYAVLYSASAGTLVPSGDHWVLTMPDEDVTISAQVVPLTVTVDPAEHGTVTADAEQPAEGQTVSLAVSPDDGWRLQSLSISGPYGEAVSLSAENTFVMPAYPVTVTAVFEMDVYPVTIGNIFGPGAVTADSDTAAPGGSVHLTVTPDEDCELRTLSVTAENGESIPCDETNTFLMPASAVTVYAEFGARRYSVATDENIVASVDRAAAGDIVILTVTEPEITVEGKVYHGVLCIPEEGEEFFVEADDGVYLLEMPQTNISLTALVDWPEDLIVSSGEIPSGKYSGSRTLRTVTIGEGVSSIGASAFSYCRKLTAVTLGDGVSSIGSAAFNGCTALEQISLPAALTNLGSGAFYGCTSLTAIAIPGGVAAIQPSAFQGCSGLETIVLSEGVRTVGTNAFGGCASLRTLSIPETVTGIGEYAFRGCAVLQTLILPDSLTSLGDGAFTGCVSLKTLKIPAAFESLNTNSYFAGHQLETLTSPAGSCLRSMLSGREREVTVTSGEILSGTFSGSRTASLQSLTLCPGVTAICSYAFDHTASLTELSIPGTVTRIEANAFYYWSGLTDIWYDGTEAEWALIADPNWAASLEAAPVVHCITPVFGAPDFTLPAFLTAIEEEAFEGAAMTIVDVPASCASIGDRAFRNCRSLRQIRIPADCILGDDVFDRCTLVYIFGYAGSSAEAYCQNHDNCVFVKETQN